MTPVRTLFSRLPVRTFAPVARTAAAALSRTFATDSGENQAEPVKSAQSCTAARFVQIYAHVETGMAVDPAHFTKAVSALNLQHPKVLNESLHARGLVPRNAPRDELDYVLKILTTLTYNDPNQVSVGLDLESNNKPWALPQRD